MEKDESLNVRISKKYARIFTIHYTKVALLFSVLIMIFVYSFISGTMTRLNYTNLGLVTVTSPSFRGGYAHEGSSLYVLGENRETHEDNFWGNFSSTFKKFDSVSEVEVKSGPYGKLDWKSSGLITVNDKIVDARLPEKPESSFLEKQYVVTCVKGSCSPGESFIVNEDDIFGIPAKGVL